MKRLMFLLLLLSCEEEQVTKVGCMTGVDKVTNQRVFIRYVSRQDYNPTNIRSSHWDTTDSIYYDYRWELCQY